MDNKDEEKVETPSTISGYKKLKFIRTLAEVEQIYILRTLETLQGNRTLSARLLGISVRCLRDKISQYIRAGIRVPMGSHSFTVRHALQAYLKYQREIP